MQQIIPNVYTFTGLRVGRVYLITQGDGLTLIDASIPPSGKRILAQLEAGGFRPNDVKRILITHAHPDHVGSVETLQAATGAQLIVPAGEQAAIEGNIPIPRASTRFRPPNTILKNMRADRTLEDGDIIEEALGGLHAIATPGHAPGHMSFWQPEQRILFCGDVVFNMRSLGLPWQFLTVDMSENIRSIGRIAALAPDVICFGHGKPIIQNASEQLRTFAQSVGAL